MTKICRICNKEKTLDKFYSYNQTGKFHSECKTCAGITCMLWRNDNKAKWALYQKQWRKKNPEKTKMYSKRNYKKYPNKNKLTHKKWVAKNRERERAIHMKAMKKYRSTTKGRLSSHFTSWISTSLKGNKKGCHWENLVGYTVEQLKSHLEEQFFDGMNWKNYGRKGWHIDHIIPISFFQYNSPADVEFRMCWRLKNLQPLWAKDNLKKNNKIIQVA